MADEEADITVTKRKSFASAADLILQVKSLVSP